MGWIRRQSPEKIHPKNQNSLERSAAASADAAASAAREAAASAAATMIAAGYFNLSAGNSTYNVVKSHLVS